MFLFATLCILIIFECVHYGDLAYHHCPVGFERHLSKCYKAVDQKASWPEAKVYCQVMGGDGGDLTTAIDRAEQRIVKDLIARNSRSTSEYRYWIDGMRIVFENEWRWMRTNGKSVPFRYTNWYPGQPEHKGERCVAAYGNDNGQWHDHWCDHLLNYVCSARARFNNLEIMSNNVDSLQLE